MVSDVVLNLSGRPYALYMIEIFKQDKIDEFRDLILEDMVCEHTGYYMYRWEVARAVNLHMQIYRPFDDKLWTRIFEWAVMDCDAGTLWDFIISEPRRNPSRNSSTISTASRRIIHKLARIERKKRGVHAPVRRRPQFCKCLKRIPLASVADS